MVGAHASVTDLISLLTTLCSWLMLQYPLPKPMRVTLVKLYYELVLIPGMDPRIIRGWADMLVKLLANKGPGSRLKLHLSDLQLQWQPLWDVLLKELFPKKRGSDSSSVMFYFFIKTSEIDKLLSVGTWLISCCMLLSNAKSIIDLARSSQCLTHFSLF
jgi:hypothetical protein